MTTEEDLNIGAVVHKAFVEVSEEGTEAVAATGALMQRVSIDPDEPVAFDVDQPFLFLIRHEPSGLVLFAGRIVNPLPR
jgi:serpin B